MRSPRFYSNPKPIKTLTNFKLNFIPKEKPQSQLTNFYLSSRTSATTEESGTTAEPSSGSLFKTDEPPTSFAREFQPMHPRLRRHVAITTT